MASIPNGRGSDDPELQRFVICDPVAFSYLEEDPSTKVVTRNATLKGYERYIVEQWACSRVDPTFIIATYTGDPSHSIIANVLAVPVNEASWSQRLKMYFGAFCRYHAKRQETGIGILMTTNLGTFPSSLTVIPIPEGNVKDYREDFFVNEDLKRLGCSGRVGITLSKPSAATAAKFYQLYKASQKIPLNAAVIELVKLCQIALMIFGKLEAEYADGLLCDVTEKAINDWWIEFGTEYYSFEPHDGVLGPTTVAALLGTLLGARSRLHAAGAPVTKDVFEIESTKRAIAYFQKTHKMPKTRRLDRQTLARLHRSTSKVASGEGWFVPRTVKSTLSEFTGKGGEMVTHMMGSRDRTITEVETVDIERFVQNVRGSRSKWLWQGKSRKSTSLDEPSTAALVNSEAIHNRQDSQRVSSNERAHDQADDRERSRLRKQPEKQQTIKPNDSGKALGKIKGAVNLWPHHEHHRHHRHHQEFKDMNVSDADRALERSTSEPAAALTHQSTLSDEGGVFPQASEMDSIPNARFAIQIAETPTDMDKQLEYHERLEPPSDYEDFVDAETEPPDGKLSRSITQSPAPSIAGSIYRGVNLDDLFEDNDIAARDIFGPGFRRTQSYGLITASQSSLTGSDGAKRPRNLSFSVAEEGLSTWSNILATFHQDDAHDGFLVPTSDFERSLRIRRALQNLDSDLVVWVQEEIQKADRLAGALRRNADEIGATAEAREEEYRELALESKQIVTSEREQLEEIVKEIELLSSKLDYETKMLNGKVEDVESGVGEFERQVLMVERRVWELERSMEPTESWSHWLLRMLTGIGENTAAPGA
jgi:hypothetical protein